MFFCYKKKVSFSLTEPKDAPSVQLRGNNLFFYLLWENCVCVLEFDPTIEKVVGGRKFGRWTTPRGIPVMYFINPIFPRVPATPEFLCFYRKIEILSKYYIETIKVPWKASFGEIYDEDDKVIGWRPVIWMIRF